VLLMCTNELRVSVGTSMDETASKRAQPTEPIESRTIGLVHKLQPFLALTAQVTSLAGIAGFVAAIILNSIIFRNWGLTFLQIASPSDVILSGLQLAIGFLIPCMGLAIGWAVGMRLFAVSHSRIWRALLPLFWIALGVLVFALARRYADYLDRTGWISIGAMWFALAIGAFEGRTAEMDGSEAQTNVWKSALIENRRLNSILCFAGFWVVAVFNQVERISGEGMFGGGRAKLIWPVLQQCNQPRAMWAGERAVVVRCVSGDILVLYRPENVEIGDAWKRVQAGPSSPARSRVPAPAAARPAPATRAPPGNESAR